MIAVATATAGRPITGIFTMIVMIIIAVATLYGSKVSTCQQSLFVFSSSAHGR